MASNIDATKPETGNATTESVRNNFSAAKTEIEALQTQVGSDNLPTHIADTETHGATGAVVGTTNSQTLTNKTLTSPTINTAAAGGTWTAASTWTVPAFTLGGTVTSNGQSFSGTIANLGTVTTVDINGGTIDGTTIGGSSAAAGTFTTVSFTGADLTADNAAGPALMNEGASSTNPTLVPNKATPATGMGASGSNTGYLISNGTEHIRWGFSAVVVTGTLDSTGTHTVGTNSSGNSATLQQSGGFQFKLNGDTASQLGTVTWVNNSGATTANLWATGDSSSGGVVRLKGIGHIDLVPGNVGIDGTAGYRHSTGVFTPPADNSQTLGSASLRWSTVYAGTGSINTSDERSKQQIEDLDAAELKVAKAIKGMVKKFKFNESVEKKGDKARIHVGVIAQEVRDAFIAEGLDPTQYSLFCYDEWDEIKEETDEDGTVLVPARPAGSRFGIRYDELLAFIIAAI